MNEQALLSEVKQFPHLRAAVFKKRSNRLEAANLSNLGLTKLPSVALLHWFPRLEILDLSLNALTVINFKALIQGVPRLRSLNLSSNRLTSIKSILPLTNLKKLESLNLTDNPLLKGLSRSDFLLLLVIGDVPRDTLVSDTDVQVTDSMIAKRDFGRFVKLTNVNGTKVTPSDMGTVFSYYSRYIVPNIKKENDSKVRQQLHGIPSFVSFNLPGDSSESNRRCLEVSNSKLPQDENTGPQDPMFLSYKNNQLSIGCLAANDSERVSQKSKCVQFTEESSEEEQDMRGGYQESTGYVAHKSIKPSVSKLWNKVQVISKQKLKSTSIIFADPSILLSNKFLNFGKLAANIPPRNMFLKNNSDENDTDCALTQSAPSNSFSRNSSKRMTSKGTSFISMIRKNTIKSKNLLLTQFQVQNSPSEILKVAQPEHRNSLGRKSTRAIPGETVREGSLAQGSFTRDHLNLNSLSHINHVLLELRSLAVKNKIVPLLEAIKLIDQLEKRILGKEKLVRSKSKLRSLPLRAKSVEDQITSRINKKVKLLFDGPPNKQKADIQKKLQDIINQTKKFRYTFDMFGQDKENQSDFGLGANNQKTKSLCRNTFDASSVNGSDCFNRREDQVLVLNSLKQSVVQMLVVKMNFLKNKGETQVPEKKFEVLLPNISQPTLEKPLKITTLQRHLKKEKIDTRHRIIMAEHYTKMMEFSDNRHRTLKLKNQICD